MYISSLSACLIQTKSGTKAYNLSIAKHNGLNVPDGFVVFIEDLNDLEQNIQVINKFLHGMPKNVKYAVRSSGINEDGSDYSFAGQYETFLNVKYDDILFYIKKCYLSSQANSVIQYKKNLQITNGGSGFGVLIQYMVMGEISGVAFTINPVTGKKQCIVEGCYSTGDEYVSGYKKDFSYTLSNVGKYPKWCKDMKNILNQLIGIFGENIDVEWTIYNNTIYILQIRTITKICNNQFRYTKENYLRMFQSEKRPFLFTSIYIDYYKELNIIVYYYKDVRKTWIPYNIRDLTLKKGLNLYQDKQYQLFYNTMFTFISEVDKFCIHCLKKSYITIDDATKFLQNMKNFFSLYSQTEFFYTDNLYLLANDNNIDTKIKNVKNPAREFFSKLFFGDSSYLYQFLKHYSHLDNINNLYWYSCDELLLLINNKTKVPHETILNRKSGYFIDTALSTYLEGTDILPNIQVLEGENIEKNTYLVGDIASSGLIKGKIYVIASNFTKHKHLKDYMDQMPQNSILVVESATPDLIYACNKASAIITNQGGFLSHAAIFCREHNIPCIVGVDSATNILKTGDNVILDANKSKGYIYFL